ncbi:lactoylglutathione lyase [Anaerocolumna sedimenticola]|uniref:Lactoylglutathione lyase n=1 Tax=Anaerocolumna sedimenticola TaxID=2696063 RepID=A0A6P1TTK0_9FIRM|nr:VOC family protein [Anaerocolumna sedimenticola]QHQ63271.1 lactoylglutathione lyase [Anaerocolumna sedimenticola]
MNTRINKDGFIQINIVVKDIKKAAGKWADLLGIPVPKIHRNHLAGNEEYPYLYRGEPAVSDLLVCNIDMGSFMIELHQPDGGPDSFQEYLDRHGNGVHHIGFEVGSKRDDLISELEKEGYKNRTVGYYPGSSWTIVDTEDDFGVNLNIKPVR